MKAEEFIENAKVVGIDQVERIDIADVMEAVKLAHNDAVKKWTMWCFNYPTPFETTICRIWGGTLSGFGGRYYCEDNAFTQHIIEKWQSLEFRRDARMMYFYCDLDTENRNKLVNWVFENYGG